MSLRMDKINSQIQKLVSEILLSYSEEIGFYVINFISTSKDLSLSNIYISFPESKQENKFNILQKHIGAIQEKFAQRAYFRKTPHLIFKLDKYQDSINKVEAILENIKNNK